MPLQNSYCFFVDALSFSSNVYFLFYTDPGSGAMLWQIIAASFVGGMFYVTFAYRKIKTFAGKIFGSAITSENLLKNNPPDKN